MSIGKIAQNWSSVLDKLQQSFQPDSDREHRVMEHHRQINWPKYQTHIGKWREVILSYQSEYKKCKTKVKVESLFVLIKN